VWRKKPRNLEQVRSTDSAMTKRAGLEAALLADFSRDNLAVYADLLLNEGDVRGELITLDLRIAVYGPSNAAVARRNEVLSELLGAPAAEQFIRYNKQPFQFGFGGARLGSVGGANLDAERALIDSPLGGYLRDVRLAGGEKHLKTGIGTLVRRTHPWLQSLHVHYETTASRKSTPIISSSQTWELIEATPALETVKVTRSTNPAAAARPVFASFDHPTVRELELG